MDNQIEVKDLDIGSLFLYKDNPVGVDYLYYDDKDKKKENICLILSGIFDDAYQLITLNKHDLVEPIEIIYKKYKVEWFEEKEDCYIINIDDNGTTREMKLVKIDYDQNNYFMRDQAILVDTIKNLFSRDYECIIITKVWRDKEIICEVKEMVYGNK